MNVSFNLNNWTYPEFLEFTDAMETELAKPYAMLPKVIESWDYEDAKAGTAMDELPMGIAADVFKQFITYLTDVSNNIDTGDVKVDLNKLTLKEFNSLNVAMREKRYSDAITLIRKAAYCPGSKADEVSATVGVKLYKALTEAHQRAITGKN